MVKTVVVDPSINRIIALSDIHSDIHAFIICLRDCARVIRKVPNINTRILPDVHKLDQDTEDMLELNLNDNEILYRDNLNYEWIGGTTNIVICGDILDGYRQLTMMRIGINRCSHDTCTNNEYDQGEIKLLRFINAINYLAINSGGRIYKILGNHDFANLGNDVALFRNYIQPYTLGEPDYYHGMNRIEYFKAGNAGSQLLLQDGAYLGLIINNNIFVHGQLDHTKNLQYYIDINNQINDISNNHLNPGNIWNSLASDLRNKTSWGRLYDRYANNTSNNRTSGNNHIKQNEKCIQVRDFLGTFHSQIQQANIDYSFGPKDLRVIVGHCPQFMGNQDNQIMAPQRLPNEQTINSTFVNSQVDGNIEILSGPTVRTGTQNLNLLFGIGMECNKRDLDNFAIASKPELAHVDDTDQRYIYKVDAGSTRGFDLPVIHMPLNEQSVQLELGSRTPQVLEINGNDDIKIIRSTILNTRIHQPRSAWETVLNNTPSKLRIPSQNIDERLPGSLRYQNRNQSYRNKYLKYKNKYIELKKKMNN